MDGINVAQSVDFNTDNFKIKSLYEGLWKIAWRTGRH